MLTCVLLFWYIHGVIIFYIFFYNLTFFHSTVCLGALSMPVSIYSSTSIFSIVWCKELIYPVPSGWTRMLFPILQLYNPYWDEHLCPCFLQLMWECLSMVDTEVIYFQSFSYSLLFISFITSSHPPFTSSRTKMPNR